LVLVIALVASPAEAGRPLTPEDAATLDPGTVEVEVGLDYLLLPGGPALNVGLLSRLEGTVAAAFPRARESATRSCG
jgi:hypothetical protein